MRKFATLPDFTNNIESMATTLRAVKDVVEQLAGLRQGESLGAPMMFMQLTEPKPSSRIVLKRGDFWISADISLNDTVTAAGNLYYWDGAIWHQLTTAVS